MKKLMNLIWTKVYEEDYRWLNWRAMLWFTKRADYEKASVCRDRIGTFNFDGPV